MSDRTTEPSAEGQTLGNPGIDEWAEQAAQFPSDYKNARILALILHLRQAQRGYELALDQWRENRDHADALEAENEALRQQVTELEAKRTP